MIFAHRFALQVFTGTSFTLLAFATGGLAAPIVAHCLYDWYTFYESHLAVTGQMEYSVEEGGRDDALQEAILRVPAPRLIKENLAYATELERIV